MQDTALLRVAEAVNSQLRECLSNSQEAAAGSHKDNESYSNPCSYGHTAWSFGTTGLKRLVDPKKHYDGPGTRPRDFPASWPLGRTSFAVGSGNSGLLLFRTWDDEGDLLVHLFPHRIGSEPNENPWSSFPRGGRRAAQDHAQFDEALAIQEAVEMQEQVSLFPQQPAVLVLGWVADPDVGMSALYLCEIGEIEGKRIRSWSQVCLVWSRQAEENGEVFPRILSTPPPQTPAILEEFPEPVLMVNPLTLLEDIERQNDGSEAPPAPTSMSPMDVLNELELIDDKETAADD